MESVIDRQESNHAVVITQNGRLAAVLITPQELERRSEQQRFLAAIDEGWPTPKPVA